jgi:dUTP pyrophosphatase
MKTRGFEVCSEYLDKNINLPIRKTKNSVGYDIETAEDITIPSIWKTVFFNIKNFLSNKKCYEDIKPTLVPTGLKSYFLEDEVLILANKSSFPLKKGLILSNSIGIIESDYYNNQTNEGHLMFMYYNIGFKDCILKKGDIAGQAYFQKFLIADNDNSANIRKGGFVSTSKN